MERDRGRSVEISREAIADLAHQAALRVDGVADLYVPPVEGIALRLRREFIHNGVKVEHEDGAWKLTLFVRAEYGADLQAMASGLKEEVKKYVEGLAGVTVSAVEVWVEDVSIPS
ncbi:MAG: Asp23/Gls24 family envelope stress response protein [Candidatus Geothermincolales bacterium]